MAVRTGHVHHRLPGFFFIINAPYIQKVPVLLAKNRDRKDNFCGTTLIAVQNGHLCPVPTHRLPVNAGIASEDTLPVGISHCPRRPIVPIRFSLRSQLCGALCGCASGFTPASKVYTMLCSLYLRCERLSRENFSLTDKCLRDVKKTDVNDKLHTQNQYSRTTPRTMPMISAWVPSMGS